MTEIKAPKKLIEVALPLNDINVASANEKQPFTRNHPRSIHIWWARRPFVAARAILFAQLVNDPGYQRELGFGVNKKAAEIKREKLFQIIRDLVKWENTNNEDVLNRARTAIWESWRETCNLNRNHPQAQELFDPEKLPAFHDPFSGGGAIPLEAQRLGMESFASDLNPVAVLINKAMIEIPPKFVGHPPVGPLPEGEKQADMIEDWSGTMGLVEDIRRYGNWVRQEAFARIGRLYPKVKITSKMVKNRPDLRAYEGEEVNVVGWLWARTVVSPNPALNGVDVPLVKSYVLSTKKSKEAYVKPVVENGNYRFEVHIGTPPTEAKEGSVGRKGGKCVISGYPIPLKYIRDQGKRGLLGTRLMAVVAEGRRERIYLPPNETLADSSVNIHSSWKPENTIEHVSGCTNAVVYGLETFGDLFTPRQLLALNTFSDLVLEAREKAIADAETAGMSNKPGGLEANKINATSYGDAIAVYLALATSRWSDMSNSVCSWNSTNQNVRALFARQAIPMNWDFIELSPFSGVGPWFSAVESVLKAFNSLPANVPGMSLQINAATSEMSGGKVVSCDPPYYDNIPYAVLSDFFYVWLRRILKEVYPTLFTTLAVPKAEELVAAPYRQGTKEKAEKYFMAGMTHALTNIAEFSHPAFPVSIYYAFKQSESDENSTVSTGWVTFLEAVIKAGFCIDGTWPVRTERESRSRGIGSNALASSILLVCRQRLHKSGDISRRDFQRQLREEMPEALETMIGGETGTTPIAPVDLAQASIGPGMAIFSKYEAVLNQDGSRMGVHDALILINRAITEYLSPESGNFDADTQFCSSWFDQYGWSTGPFGEADTLARAKGTSVDGVHEAGVLESGGGKVRLLKWAEYEADWDPTTDNRTPVWEACHQLIRSLNNQGESAAGELLAKMPEKGEPIRQLAYHLYTLCERKKWAEDARAYNELIGSWHAIVTASHEVGHSGSQAELGLDF